jgi:hypothetical protein
MQASDHGVAPGLASQAGTLDFDVGIVAAKKREKLA